MCSTDLKSGLKMTPRFHEISESRHPILNPFTEDKFMLVGEICDLKAGVNQLDLCCGKGKILFQWSRRYFGWGVFILQMAK